VGWLSFSQEKGRWDGEREIRLSFRRSDGSDPNSYLVITAGDDDRRCVTSLEEVVSGPVRDWINGKFGLD
jgi:hypothetical protein